MTQSEKEFVRNNLKADVSSLLLNPPKGRGENIKYLADQIKARQKAKGKLPSWYANFDLIFPPPLSIEQCSSEVAASYKSHLASGESFVDLTGGMGVDCMAFSEHFKSVYVEQNPRLVEAFEHNCNVLGKEIETHCADASIFLQNLDLKKATFFIDPARRDEQKKKVFKFSDCSPNVIELLPLLKGKAEKLIIKASPLIDIQLGTVELGGVSEVYVLSIANECKEVLFVMDFNRLTHDPIIHTINIQIDNEHRFSYSKSEEESATASYGELKNFLLIPNASILKAGAFKTVSERFGIDKLGKDTHLYTADQLVEDFLGRQFEILDTTVDKKIIQKHRLDKVNVITRNHPQKPSDILKKFKLKEGGDMYLIGFRDLDSKVRLVIGRLI